MVNTLINQSDDLCYTYDAILQFDIGGGDTKQLKFVQDIVVRFDDSALEVDLIDTGAPFYTRRGDRLGSFSFIMKNSVDMFDTVTPATNEETISYWREKTVTPPHATLSMILKEKAPESGGDQFANTLFGGRVLIVDTSRTRGRDINETIVSGDLTTHTSSLRQST